MTESYHTAMDIDDNDPIRYDRWIEDALRSVIHKALSYVAEHGLTGDHHFYITFRTDTDAVTMPDHMRVQHPAEMTIVLQHQYEELLVGDNEFSVTLRFNGKPERLNVPFDEVTGFTDPSVNFGLQLKNTDFDDDEDIDDFDYPFESAAEEQGNAAPGSTDSEDDAVAKTGEVIALDAFRKK